MKTFLRIVQLFFLMRMVMQAQFERFGLEDHYVFDLREYGGRIYAATDNGAYVRNIFGPDKGWQHIGLAGMRVRAIYPHSFGPLGYAVTAGIDQRDTLSPRTYCTENSDTSWFASDDGIDRSTVPGILTLDGFPSPVICGETFAGGYGQLYRRTFGSYDKVVDIGIGATNAVRTDERTRRVWVGGETGIFAPYIFLSEDLGSTWHEVYPFLGGDNACNVLEPDWSDTSVVYAGMEGAVMKSTDGGRTWTVTGLRDTRFYIYGLATTQSETVFAAGAASVGSPPFALFESRDGGNTWKEIPSTENWTGFRCAILLPTALPEESWLLIGTLGDGVLLYRVFTTPVDQLPDAASLSFAYPSPARDNVYLYARARVYEDRWLSVYTLDGRLVLVKKIPAGIPDATITTSTWPPGVYLYRISGNHAAQAGTILISR